MIDFRGVYFKYRRGPVVLQNFTAQFSNSLTIILGPNGCGKSTLLKIAAGILKPTEGIVEILGKPPDELRGKIAYIPQSGGLYPWMTVEENIALPLKLLKKPEREIRETVHKVSEILEISDLLKRYPREISGGEQQKVLLARAMASGADVWLLDEPFSMIDIDYRRELIQILRGVGKVMVVITHNVQDAIDLGGEIYVVNGPPLKITAVLKPGDYTKAEELTEVVKSAFKK
ncbi:ABC transporter related protein [Pyrobaculum islandicum DSM 4184]|uniref:ABC transporter related protein n=1 Tax=Pyrobaculum islandicum (strain DSM 4184 / JCM 9189 / GEO3) TaxID=384616 RepID=A1RUX7_PYRIL|nr:ATP-binding cassette domain-containing protein [Pyrobaculum islandicum]ABL88759.1 ABC transporter related protein [Pyrobaculum islandicum DSM 4184]